MKKSYIVVFTIILIAIVGIGAFQYYNRPDGSTVESREELIGKLPKGANWKIATEQNFNDYIISGMYSADGKSGIAVFVPAGDGKYKLQSREWRDNNDIIISGTTIDGVWYDLVWFNGAQTEYAQIIYTIDGKTQEPIRHDSTDMKIFVNQAPSKDYILSVTYYDSEGNKYE